jgi:predicted O-linked N-acetylglucosamine transferase (SPINDLY family)
MDQTLLAAELVEKGLLHHQKGEIVPALTFYKKALAIAPLQPDAHNLSAEAYYRSGNNLKALFHANQAVAQSRNAQFLNVRGMVLIGLSKFEEAISDLRAAIKIDGNLLEAHNNLSIAYRGAKDFKRALLHAQYAINGRPEFYEAILSFAAAKQEMGELDIAISTLKSALILRPENPITLGALAKLYYRLENFEDAVIYGLDAIRFGYINLDVYFSSADSLIRLGRVLEAAKLLFKGFQNEGSAAYNELQNILEQDIFFKVLVDCCQYLATVIGDSEGAVRIYEQSAKYAPAVAHAIWVNLGTIYFKLHRFPDAIRCNEEALKLNPQQIWAFNNLGVCKIAQNDSLKAIEYFQRALTLDPSFAPSLGLLLKEKGFICDWNDFDNLVKRVSALKGTQNSSAIAPFTSLSVFNDPAELLSWARLSSQELFNSSITSASFEKSPPLPLENRRVRIGYYSFDFRNHPVAHLTARLFEVHDHEKFEIYAYSYGPDDGSAVRERIKYSVEHFIDLKDLSVIDTAKRIAQDQIDILIDLTGNTLHNRSQIFALRPARIQAHWLGFVGTMGSEYYDYIIADSIVAPAGDEPFFTEKILRLPSGMHIMDDTRVIEASHQTRAGNGLPDSGIIFGCFCQTFKIQPEIFSLWIKILLAVPDSVLWLASGPEGSIENLRDAASLQGIDPKRIVIANRCNMDEYLSRFSLIDLYLDTFPYTSGTVASDALLGSCPLLTLSGKTMVSRMAASILTHAGLPELIAYSPQEYVEKAISIATDQQERLKIKKYLLDKRNSNELLNTKKNIKLIEESLEKMLQ